MSDAINRFLHEKVMSRGCWHEFPEGVRKCESKCVVCGEHEDMSLGGWFIPRTVPDYCSDLNAMAEVEAKVIELKGAPAYWDALYEPFNRDDIRHASLLAATAPAAVRAMACAKVMGWEG
jgi:hypothetical protein